MLRPTPTTTAPSTRTLLSLTPLEAREVPSVAPGDDPSLPAVENPNLDDFTSFTQEPGRTGDPLLAQPRGRYAVASSGGRPSTVNVYDSATNAMIGIVTPFGPGYSGSIRLATGDVTGDGIEDLVVAAGPGAASRIKVYDGGVLVEVQAFDAYTPDYTGGTYLAVGDVDGDGRADVVTGTGVGGGPHVKVFGGRDLFPGGDVRTAVQPFPRHSFFAYAAEFRGGVSVAVGDVDGDGRADIVTGAGVGGGPHVRAFDGASFAELESFFAYSADFRGGVFVAVGDFDGNGRAEIATSPMQGGGPIVRIYDEAGVIDLQPFDAELRTGFAIAVQDVDGDAADELVVATGPGVSPQAKVIDPRTGATLRSFPAFLPDVLGGLYVG